jgi:PiT family inorganic phosphate transporter
MESDLVLVIVVATALAFDFTNGFHDTANVVATGISTRAVPPRTAVAGAAILNFVGAFISLEVAATVASGIVEADLITPTIVFAGLIGAIAWNLVTWWYGLPSSSSHALIGGVVGSAIAAEGTQAVISDGLVGKVLIPALIAPVLAFAVAGLGILCAYRIIGRLRPGSVNRGFRHGQLVSGGLLALSHGTNDAQKTMGIITLALFSAGLIESVVVPTWVIIVSATALSLGTAVGGWRIMHTMGHRVVKLEPVHGFAAETTAASVLFMTARLGMPVSTTHVISSAIMGVGSARGVRGVRWGVARGILLAWIITIPAAGFVAAVAWIVLNAIGLG